MPETRGTGTFDARTQKDKDLLCQNLVGRGLLMLKPDGHEPLVSEHRMIDTLMPEPRGTGIYYRYNQRNSDLQRSEPSETRTFDVKARGTWTFDVRKQRIRDF